MTKTDSYSNAETVNDKKTSMTEENKKKDMVQKQKQKLQTKIDFWRNKEKERGRNSKENQHKERETGELEEKKLMTVTQKLMYTRNKETERRKEKEKETLLKKKKGNTPRVRKQKEILIKGQARLTWWTEPETEEQKLTPVEKETEAEDVKVRKKLIGSRRNPTETAKKPLLRQEQETGNTEKQKLKLTPSKPQKRKCDGGGESARETDSKKSKQETVREILARIEGKNKEKGETEAFSRKHKFKTKNNPTCFSGVGQGAQVEGYEGVPGHQRVETVGVGCEAELDGQHQHLMPGAHAKLAGMSRLGAVSTTTTRCSVTERTERRLETGHTSLVKRLSVGTYRGVKNS